MEGSHINHRTYRIGRRDFDVGGRTLIMGVLNVTPDSFSDGGKYVSPERAIERALAMVEEGADIIDVGGESTRPRSRAYGEGASDVDTDEELRRVLPVIAELTRRIDTPVSIDTMKSIVARRALDAGAVIVNDVSGFRFDPEMPQVVSSAGASAVVMHLKGSPQTMQQNPVYDDLFGEILDALGSSVRQGEEAGVRQMFVDPGIGFGKTLDHNLQIIAGLERFGGLGYPILVGPSRKTFIGTLLGLPVGERLEGTLAAVVACVLHGAAVVRVHDVREAKRAVTIADAIRRSGEKNMAQHGQT